MEVILREDVHKLGNKGDLVRVKDGYARNYLLPRRLALLATPGTRKQVADMKAAAARKDATQKSAAESLAEQMSAVELSFTVKAGENDQLFGSVTSMDIAEALGAKGFTVDKRRVELAEPIKTLGEYTIPVWIHGEVTANIKLQVVREEGEQEGQAGHQAKEEEEKKKE